MMRAMTSKIEPFLRENLLMLARAFAQATGRTKLGGISRLVYNDGRFFDQLAAEEISFTARKYDEAVAWFAKNWPKDSVMPALIDPQHVKVNNGAKPSQKSSPKKISNSKVGGKKEASRKASAKARR